MDFLMLVEVLKNDLKINLTNDGVNWYNLIQYMYYLIKTFHYLKFANQVICYYLLFSL